MGRKLKDKVPPAVTAVCGTVKDLPAASKAKPFAEDSTAKSSPPQQDGESSSLTTWQPDNLTRLMGTTSDELPEVTGALVDEIARLGDDDCADRVRQIITATTKVETAAWVLRGACGWEVARRPDVRYPEGLGRPDPDGKGLRNTLRTIAESCGVKLATLEDDVRIFKMFVARRLDDGASPEAIRAARTALIGELFQLPRAYFLVAITTIDPMRSIEVAERRLTERDQVRGYSVGKFRAEVKAKLSPPETETVDIDEREQDDKLDFVEITCSITIEEQDCLWGIAEATSSSIDRAVGRSLQKYWDDLRLEAEVAA